jgi:opacity protein-like surface antigen
MEQGLRQLMQFESREESLMKRILTLCALIAALASVPAAQAQVSSNGSVPTFVRVDVGCADGDQGETVFGVLNVHWLVEFAENDNRIQGNVQMQVQGGDLLGSVTGDKYQASGVTRSRLEGSLQNGQVTEWFTNKIRVVGPGPGNNYVLTEIFRFTVNANGDTTVFVESISEDCK